MPTQLPMDWGRPAPARRGPRRAALLVAVVLAVVASISGLLAHPSRAAEDLPRLAGPITDLTDTLSPS